MAAGKAFFTLGLFLFAHSALGADIRAETAIDGLEVGPVPYVATLSDCDDITDIATNNGGSPSLNRGALADGVCTARFSVSGGERLSPRVEVSRLGGHQEILNETFPVEDRSSPGLSLENVSVQRVAGQQLLVVDVQASDDTDLRYITASVTGIRASVLRSVGGVVTEAARRAFASADAMRVYPVDDGQNQFSISIPVSETLSQDVIAADALAVVDLAVTDAYGNQTSLSEIRFIGQDISESVEGMRVVPERVVITSPLQKPALVPVVDFQFRGEVALPGGGSDVSYSSSHPDLVGVTSSGVIYALEETGDSLVTISVSHPGTASVEVPVVVDFSVTVDALKLKGVSSGTPLVLPRLNKYLSLPDLSAVLSNGETVPIPESQTREVEILDETPLLEVNQKGEIQARGAIPESSPVDARLSLSEMGNVALDFSIAARDAAPEVVLQAPSRVTVGSELRVRAGASDDVGIERVEFLVDGAPVSVSREAPHELILPISEQMLGKALSLVAMATDTAGNNAQSSASRVSVTREGSDFHVDGVTMELPRDGQRVVERAPTTVQVVRSMGGNPQSFEFPVQKVLFYAEGEMIGEAVGPLIEDRSEVSDQKDYYEVWRSSIPMPSISTEETSLAVSAKLLGQNGGEQWLPTRLVRVVANKPPSAQIVEPVAGRSITAGAPLEVAVRYGDDTGAFGAEVELLDGDKVLKSRSSGQEEVPETDALTPGFSTETFTVPTSEEDVGKQFELRARITDYHGETFITDIRSVPVVGDQPPTVSISHPLEGTSHVAGLPLNLRASAVDDVGVKRVDFFVDGVLIGSDYTAPYSIRYDSEPVVDEEQRITISATAYDSADKTADAEPVSVVLGHDEVAPTVNVASPVITQTDTGSGLDLAPVLENDTFVLKFTGFDNIGATKVAIEGISRAPGGYWALTGQADDVVTQEQLTLQRLPGAANAFSVVLLVQSPAFSDTANIERDLYRLAARVSDKAGNSSLAEFAVAVGSDQAPEVVRLSSDKPAYELSDTMAIGVQAVDDKAVDQLEYRLFNEGQLVLEADRGTGGQDFIALQNIQDTLSVPVPELNLDNQSTTLVLEVVAVDENGARSQAEHLSVDVLEDDQGPLFTITSPAPMSRLQTGQSRQFHWRAEDSNGLSLLKITEVGGDTLVEREPSGQTLEGSFNLTLPELNTPLVLNLVAVDQYGNRTERNQTWRVEENQPPQIDIRHPAPGERLEEGESLAVNFSLSDDGVVESARVFAELDGVELFEHEFGQGEIAGAIAAANYLSARVPVPTRPEGAQDFRFLVEAVDEYGAVARESVPVEIVDDLDAPVVEMTKPASKLSVMPGSRVELAGTVVDNNATNTIEVVVRTGPEEEVVLPWDQLMRSDKTETIRLPNPGSLGSVVAGERSVTTYDGSVFLPKDWVSHAGETFSLFVRVRDHGPNIAESLAQELTVLPDEEQPLVKVVHPGDTVVERTEPVAEIQVADNVGLDRVTVTLEGTTDTLTTLFDEGAEGKTRLDITELELPLPASVPEEGLALRLQVNATDLGGNEKIVKHLFRVMPDTVPSISVNGLVPERLITAGSASFQTLTVEDDYFGEGVPVLPLSTTLSGTGDTRTLSGGYLTAGQEDVRPAMFWDYPEVDDGQAVELLINDRPVVSLDARSTLTAVPDEVSSLEIAADGQEVAYRVRKWSKSPCHPALVEQEFPAGPLNVETLLTAETTHIEVIPLINGVPARELLSLKSLIIYGNRLDELQRYSREGEPRSTIHLRPVGRVLIDDAGATSGLAALELFPFSVTAKGRESVGLASLAPADIADVRETHLFAHALDRFATERDEVALTALRSLAIRPDQQAPTLSLRSPVSGAEVVVGETLRFRLQANDDTGVLKNTELRGAGGDLLFDQASRYQAGEYEFLWAVPGDMQPGLLPLHVSAEDAAGHRKSLEVLLPVKANAPPELNLLGFASYRVGNEYRKNYTDMSRLALNEFWVRVGESFRLSLEAFDDAALEQLSLWRVAEDGTEIPVRNYQPQPQCPELPEQHIARDWEVTFDQPRPTEYILRTRDSFGQQDERRFIVNPQINVAPGVRIITPDNDQSIAAGTFAIPVRVIASDDRQLDGDFTFFANGRELSVASSQTFDPEKDSNQSQVTQALAEIYDAFEENYGPDVAGEHATLTSENLTGYSFVLSLPSALAAQGAELELDVRVADSDGATGEHGVNVLLAPDDIRPEGVIKAPGLGDRVYESSQVDAAFAGYDNVKVEALELYTTYGAQANGAYIQAPYGAPARVEDAIPAMDAVPISTVNIDTPTYTQRIGVPRLTEVASDLGVALVDVERADLWLKVLIRDASGNVREREISVPIRVDQRPTVDVMEPAPGSSQVENSDLYVNVNASDDVALDSVRLTAEVAGEEIFNTLLRQPPYAYSVSLPAFDDENATRNIVDFHVEAIDSYGAAYGDLDQHRATEDFQVKLVSDTPPTVSISNPEDGDRVTEGQALVVQAEATDDLGVDRVALEVSGLVTGSRTLIDYDYPYEFLINVPYGQAGAPLTLNASVTEERQSDPRTVSAISPVTVGVDEDTEAPEVTLLAPGAGAVAVEQRTLPYRYEAVDNVRVSVSSVSLQVDGNGDGLFSENEERARKVILVAPFSGAFVLDSFDTYLGGADDGSVNELAARLNIVTRDGAGNETVVEAPFIIVRNQPPQVSGIDILDTRGFSLGASLDRITEGREIVVSVSANDPESGVDQVTLYRALGEAGDLQFEKVGDDLVAPFQFATEVPLGHVDKTLAFAAEARDVDGNESDLSTPRELTIGEDQPPTAEIISPSNDSSAVIRGEPLSVAVRVQDDLGLKGVERVDILINDAVAKSVYESVSDTSSNFGQGDIYRTELLLPDGQDGVTVQAVAHDIFGHTGASQVVRVGVVEDTVAPKLDVLAPVDGDVLTAGEPLRTVVSVRDLGDDSGRTVTQTWIREYRDENGAWQTLAQRALSLKRDDQREPADDTPVSDPDNYQYIYWADFADGAILRRDMRKQERLRVISRIDTKNHSGITQTTLHEVGLPVDRRRFVLPEESGSAVNADDRGLAESVYYSALARYQGPVSTGALLAAWNTFDPALMEPGIGNVPATEVQDQFGEGGINAGIPLRSGLVMLDAMEVRDDDGKGREYLYSPLLMGASDVFLGAISSLHADRNFVLAGKAGLPDAGAFNAGKNGGFTQRLEKTVGEDPETGGMHLENGAGELLIFTTQNGDGQFGLPYGLLGRVDMPFPDVHAVERQGSMAFVANGNGGVQVVDIADLSSPYRVSFIKPDGYTRDVEQVGDFLYIAASAEGVVVADITDPSLPIVASVDTLGVANRLQRVGDRLYVTNMAGQGRVSELNIFDISDARHPQLLKTVAFEPSRGDHVADGTYGVYVSGNVAYVSVLESDQEDRPAQTRVEAVKLGLLEQSDQDASVPVVTHRTATDINHSLRDILMVDGRLEMAAGRGGVARTSLAELAVVQHTPTQGETQVNTGLEQVTLELSAVLAADTELGDNIRVYRGQWPFAEEVSDSFNMRFGIRDGLPARRFIEVLPKVENTWQAGETYHVEVGTGLTPLGGEVLSMSDDYRLTFTMSPAGDAALPVISSIVPNVGDVSGGTAVTLSGSALGAEPRVTIGGREAVVQSVTAGGADSPDQVQVITPPNYAGPATVRLVNDQALSTQVYGGFRYSDDLKISFLEPGVVSTSQAGEGDQVRVVGYGFHPGVTLRAWPSGQRENVTEDAVGGERLSLESSTSMQWVVPDLGSGYRGFLDVEVTDEAGRRYWLPRALFYGKLEVSRSIDVGDPVPLEEREAEDYVPDAGRLPPGQIMDIASDAGMNLLYVLGRGTSEKARLDVADSETFEREQPPGWISLVHYQRDALDMAAPQHQLGYLNLPQALAPVTLKLANENLYVAAQGYDLPFIEVPYEQDPYLLVYDREDRTPSSTGDGQSRDRSMRYALPLPFANAPRKLLHRDQLLIAQARDGVAIIGLSNPLRPGVVEVIREAVIDGGARSLNDIHDAWLDGDHLVVQARLGSDNEGSSWRLVYDLAATGAPQVGASQMENGHPGELLLRQQSGLASRANLKLYDVSAPALPVPVGRYQSTGLSIDGSAQGAAAGNSLFATYLRQDCNSGIDRKKTVQEYIQLLDVSRPGNVLLQGALKTFECDEVNNRFNESPLIPRTENKPLHPLLLTDDGLLATVSDNTLRIVDTLTQDLRSVAPEPGSQGVSIDSVIELDFSLPVEIPLMESDQGYLSEYINVRLEDGSVSGEAVPVRCPST